MFGLCVHCVLACMCNCVFRLDHLCKCVCVCVCLIHMCLGAGVCTHGYVLQWPMSVCPGRCWMDALELALSCSSLYKLTSRVGRDGDLNTSTESSHILHLLQSSPLTDQDLLQWVFSSSPIVDFPLTPTMANPSSTSIPGCFDVLAPVCWHGRGPVGRGRSQTCLNNAFKYMMAWGNNASHCSPFNYKWIHLHKQKGTNKNDLILLEFSSLFFLTLVPQVFSNMQLLSLLLTQKFPLG